MRFIIGIVFLMHSYLYGCLWLRGTTLDGEYKEFSGESPSHLFDNSIKNKPMNLFSERVRHKDIHTTEAIAVAKIIDKKYQDAIKYLLALEKEQQGVYSTASNIAVAYELQGDIENAIHWTQEALKRNKQAHYNTEWLHLFILKSKLKIRDNLLSLGNAHLIELPKTYDDNTYINIDGERHTISEVRNALIYQLKERTLFVKPKNAIVADLFYTLAEIEAHTRIIDEAIQIFHYSELYGFPNMVEINDKIDMYENAYWYAYMRYGLMIILGSIFLFYMKRYLARQIPIKDEKIILNTVYSVSIVLSLIVAFTLLGTFIHAALAIFLDFMKDTQVYYGAIFGYFFGLFQIRRYMRQKNYVVQNKNMTIVWSIILVTSIYLYLLILLFQERTIPVVILYFLLLGLYVILKKTLPETIK